MSTAPTASGREDLKSTTYEFFILAISILSIVNLVLVFVFTFESQSWWLVAIVDAILTVIFLADFTYRLLTAPTKRWYSSVFTGTVNWVQIDLGEDAEDVDHLITPEERLRVAMARQ